MQRSEPWLEQRGRRLYVQVARSPSDVRAAQRLRYEVFAIEMGAQLNGPEAGVDEDRFDAHCDHLLMLLPLAQLNPRYARHYLGDAAAGTVFAPPTLTR